MRLMLILKRWKKFLTYSLSNLGVSRAILRFRSSDSETLR